MAASFVPHGYGWGARWISDSIQKPYIPSMYMAAGWDDLQKGRFCIVFSAMCLSEVILNGILGVFPAGFFGQGSLGQKFYLFPWLTQQFGEWNGQAFWTDAGFLSEQEYGFIVLHLVFAYVGLTYLRRENDMNKQLRLDSDDWSWIKKHDIILSGFIPMGIMWMFVIAILSIWVIILMGIAIILIVLYSIMQIEPQKVTIPIASSLPKEEAPVKSPSNSETIQTISDSVAGGDVVGGDKVVNDPDTIAKVAIEAYRMGVSDSKD